MAEWKEQRKLEKHLKNQRIKRKPKNSRIVIKGFDKALPVLLQPSANQSQIPEESKDDEVNLE